MAKQRRPSYPSIRRRQRNIIEGMGTHDLKYAEAAKRLGVTRHELVQFLESKPKVVRARYNRSPSSRKLFEEGERHNVKQEFGLPFVRRYEHRAKYLEAVKVHLKHPNSKQIGRMIARYYYKDTEKFRAILKWTIYTREHNLPLSIKAIKFLARNGKIDEDTYTEILEKWQELYRINSTVYESYQL